MNFCQIVDCNTSIMPNASLCGKHARQAPKAKKARRGGKPSFRKNSFHDASGKVRPNMGLARLKEQDRQKWLMRQDEKMVESICAFFRGLATWTG
jgi:hypothetical protein